MLASFCLRSEFCVSVAPPRIPGFPMHLRLTAIVLCMPHACSLVSAHVENIGLCSDSCVRHPIVVDYFCHVLFVFGFQLFPDTCSLRVPPFCIASRVFVSLLSMLSLFAFPMAASCSYGF